MAVGHRVRVHIVGVGKVMRSTQPELSPALAQPLAFARRGVAEGRLPSQEP